MWDKNSALYRIGFGSQDSDTGIRASMQKSETDAFILYNEPLISSQFIFIVKIFQIFADNLCMKQFFQGLVLGILLMYLYLNYYSAGSFVGIQHWFSFAR
jgi:hypothetical protein